MDGVKRVESMNDGSLFIQAITDIAKNHLEQPAQLGQQMLLRCPGCTSAKCESMRNWAQTACV